jgi:hypothetical protein
MHAISRVSSRAFKGPSAPQEKLIFIKPEKARMTSSRHHPRSHSPRRPPAGPRDPDQFFSPCSPECAASAACDQVSRRSCAHGAESLEGEEGRMLFFGAMFPIPSSHFKTFAHAELKWLSDACRTIALRGTDRKENEHPRANSSHFLASSLLHAPKASLLRAQWSSGGTRTGLPRGTQYSCEHGPLGEAVR